MSVSRGFTLTEILIAVTLMGLVVLTIASVDITSHHFLRSITESSRVKDEAMIAVAHTVRRFACANEIYDFDTFAGDPFTIGVRLDIDPATRAFNNTPEVRSDDTWVVYRFDGASSTIQYYSYANQNSGPPRDAAGNLQAGWVSWQTTATGSEAIASDIFVDGTTPDMFTVTNNRIDIDITAQDALYASINLKRSVVLRSMSGS